jgi:hypothetical protein
VVDIYRIVGIESIVGDLLEFKHIATAMTVEHLKPVIPIPAKR